MCNAMICPPAVGKAAIKLDVLQRMEHRHHQFRLKQTARRSSTAGYQPASLRSVGDESPSFFLLLATQHGMLRPFSYLKCLPTVWPEGLVEHAAST